MNYNIRALCLPLAVLGGALMIHMLAWAISVCGLCHALPRQLMLRISGNTTGERKTEVL